MCRPSWQKTHVPSEHTNGATTRSPALSVRDVGADVLDDADELVAHPPAGVVGGHRLVRPEVAAADAARVTRTRASSARDPGVRDILDPDVAGAVHEGVARTRWY